MAFCADAVRKCFAVRDLQPLDALGLRETAAGSEVVKLDVLVCPGAAERVGSVPAPLRRVDCGGECVGTPIERVAERRAERHHHVLLGASAGVLVAPAQPRLLACCLRHCVFCDRRVRMAGVGASVHGAVASSHGCLLGCGGADAGSRHLARQWAIPDSAGVVQCLLFRTVCLFVCYVAARAGRQRSPLLLSVHHLR